jgi:GNAT superfamily N-acetyltransferase
MKTTWKFSKMATPRIFDPTKHLHLLPQFLDIHQACITQDFTLAVFLPHLRNDEMLRWWEARVDEVRTGTRRIIFATKSPPDGLESVVAGIVSLSMPLAETGPFRGIVEKLLVSPRFRRRGVATTLMLKLEEVARAEGRPLLVSLLFTSASNEFFSVLTVF